MIPEVMTILKRIEEIHRKKNEDYTSGQKYYENFERASYLIGWFKNNDDKAFVNHIATKLARLSSLLTYDEKKPNNESIDDTFLDLCTYCILWMGNYQYRNSTYMEELTRSKHTK